MTKPLGVNQKVPHLVLKDIFGSRVNLATYTKGYTLLVFLRYAGCPWCNLAIHRLSIEYDRLSEKHCNVVAFIQSDKQSVVKNIYDRHPLRPQFPIIADQAMKFYKQFGVKPSLPGTIASITKLPYWLESVRKLGFHQTKLDGSFFLVPAWFLINNTSGRIVKSERGVSFYDHETFLSIYDSLQFQD
jgi:peroxiredoxin Q/BCP